MWRDIARSQIPFHRPTEGQTDIEYRLLIQTKKCSCYSINISPTFLWVGPASSSLTPVSTQLAISMFICCLFNFIWCALWTGWTWAGDIYELFSTGHHCAQPWQWACFRRPAPSALHTTPSPALRAVRYGGTTADMGISPRTITQIIVYIKMSGHNNNTNSNNNTM